MRVSAGRVRPSRRRQFARSLACAAIVAALATSPAAHSAEPSLLAAVGESAPETIVVQVVVNGERKGQYFAAIAGGQLYLRRQDLAAASLPDVRGRARTIDGESYVAIDAIEGVRATFDERKLVVELWADPGLLGTRSIDLWPRDTRPVIFPTNPSAFLNYGVSEFGGSDGQPTVTALAAEFGGRIGDFLFMTDGTCDIASGRDRCVRLMTSVTHDNRATLNRTILGDFAASTGWLGSTVLMGGVSFSKFYGIDPYVITYPQKGVTGQLRTASDVDIYIDGQKVNTMHLPAGEFDLRNVTQSTGYRNVDVVVRDAYGREQRVDASWYTTEAMLKTGLHEYSYNVGALRENYGLASNDYGPFAFALFHRYGITDSLTVGGRAEGVSDRFNLGPTVSVALEGAGILSAAVLASDDHGDTGAAGAIAWSYAGPRWSAGAFARKDSPRFAQLWQSADERRNYEATVYGGYTFPAFGSVSLGLGTYRAYVGQDRDTVVASYARTLFGGKASVYVTVASERSDARTTNAFAGLVWYFDSNYSLSANYRRFRGTDSESLQFQKVQPAGEGLGYTLAVDHTSDASGSGTAFNPSFQYNGRWGTVRGYAAQYDTPGGTRRNWQIGAAGGIAWAGDSVAVGRPVTDGFGIVKVDEQADVPVYANGQYMGSTGRGGTVFIPTLASFTQNQVSIDTRNVPLDLSFPEATLRVSPPYRGGAVIDFQARRLRAFVGRVEVRTEGRAMPAEFYEVALDVGGRPVTFMTGRGGEFYVEDLKPGTYKGRLVADGKGCRFDLVVPDTAGPLVELPPVACDWGR